MIDLFHLRIVKVCVELRLMRPLADDTSFKFCSDFPGCEMPVLPISESGYCFLCCEMSPSWNTISIGQL